MPWQRVRKKARPDPREKLVQLDPEFEHLRQWILIDSKGFPRLTYLRKNVHLSHQVLGVSGHHARVFYRNGNRLDCRRENLTRKRSEIAKEVKCL